MTFFSFCQPALWCHTCKVGFCSIFYFLLKRYDLLVQVSKFHVHPFAAVNMLQTFLLFFSSFPCLFMLFFFPLSIRHHVTVTAALILLPVMMCFCIFTILFCFENKVYSSIWFLQKHKLHVQSCFSMCLFWGLFDSLDTLDFIIVIII